MEIISLYIRFDSILFVQSTHACNRQSHKMLMDAIKSRLIEVCVVIEAWVNGRPQTNENAFLILRVV